jgi:hypothetical protein
MSFATCSSTLQNNTNKFHKNKGRKEMQAIKVATFKIKELMKLIQTANFKQSQPPF